ncbi:flagellar protein FliS [Altererythrobacter atlanticus]|uniref:Uncharacterized protein n=1 Tax=Croceibacterium atlanticum TaxID=1267766 RepID=A0A0F7KY30_9SPHN|nr:flagellar protein FliS [Croceibacterium atlanticum]AKH44151.1 hypothetical protein WYH_03132 [Croceibacterium atlanticum]MBB5732461.1 flagellar protein FliS [Croceibacterium atlanticum]
MLALTDPHEAYRRSEIDARVSGGNSADLVRFCLSQVIEGLGGAIAARGPATPTLRSKSITRALTALTALEMGVDRGAPLAGALLQVYGSARRALLDCVTDFDADRLRLVRQDLADIQQAFSQTA